MANLKTTDKFVEQASSLYLDRYEYTKVDYRGCYIEICVTCKIHGDFQTKPYSFLSGNGCKKCGVEKRNANATLSLQEVLDKFVEIHGSVYDYSKVNYLGDNIKVEVICQKHGAFLTTPGSHKRGSGCPICGRIRLSNSQRHTIDSFIKRSVEVHGDYYDYSRSLDYSSTERPVSIICPAHGLFKQLAGNHMSGKGCPSCASYGYDSSKPGIFYILVGEGIVKVGITNHTSADRCTRVKRSSGLNFTVHTEIKSNSGKWVSDLENMVLKWLRSKYKNPQQKFEGYTECFVDVPLDEILSFLFPFKGVAP